MLDEINVYVSLCKLCKLTIIKQQRHGIPSMDTRNRDLLHQKSETPKSLTRNNQVIKKKQTEDTALLFDICFLVEELSTNRSFFSFKHSISVITHTQITLPWLFVGSKACLTNILSSDFYCNFHFLCTELTVFLYYFDCIIYIKHE